MKYKLDHKSRNIFFIGAGLLLLTVFLLKIPAMGKFLRGFFAVISPFTGGFALAYLLNRPVMLLESLLIRLNFSKNKSVLRITAVVIAILLTALLLAGLCYIILPQLLRNLAALFERLPDYYRAAAEFFTKFCEKLPVDLSSLTPPDFDGLLRQGYEYLLSVSGQLADAGVSFLSGIITSVTNISIGVISGIYLLIFKESMISAVKKALFAFFPKSPTENAIDLLRDTNRIFMSYLYSKLLASLGVGILTFLAMLIFGLPYSPLISAIMTVFNLIPFFGPFLGAIPSILLLLLNEPNHALTFLLITVGVQFIDNQFLTPKIVGDNLKMNPFWVLFSIVIGGSIGGIGGMFFGVPLFAVFFGILRLLINRRLKEKGLSTDSADYHTPKVRK